METKSYVLNSTIQLIDINNDYNKFQTIYNITCDNLQDDFEYAIVSQKRLDEKQFQFKKAIGYIEDSFTQTDDVNTDWYLVLKAPKDTPCNVMINITSLDEPKINTDVEYFDEDDVLPEQQLPPSRPPKRRPIPRTRIRTKPIVYEYENESEDEKETKKKVNGSDKSKMYKYIFIGLVVILLIILGLWWSGYLYKLPFLSKFAPSSSPNENKYPITQYPIVQQTPPQFQQPRPDIPLPKPPQPLHIPTPNVPLSEPQQYIPDSNFINEMRELKIDI